jgi:hypothetical protein
MSRYLDLREFLRRWPYDPDQSFRLVKVRDRRKILLVRRPMGREEYEVDGWPDGLRPHGMESALDFQLERSAAAKRAGAPANYAGTMLSTDPSYTATDATLIAYSGLTTC